MPCILNYVTMLIISHMGLRYDNPDFDNTQRQAELAR